jgi:hypothetical protein
MHKISLRTFPLHPFLLAVFPVLSLLADNIVEITFSQSVRSLAWSLAGTLLIFLLFWLATRSAQKAGLATSFIVVAFYSFGHVYMRLHGALPGGSLLGRLDVLMAIWASGLIIGAWLLARKLRDPLPLTLLVNVVALAALVTALYPLGVYSGKKLLAGPFQIKQPADLALQAGGTGEKPDIYYIILDGYGRHDALQEIHKVDDSEFLRFLEGRGFIVAGQSTTNYARTNLSLASSLNYHYLHELIEARPESDDYDAYRYLINNSAVQRFLKAQGYRTVAMATGFEMAEVSGADVFLNEGRQLSYFEETLLARSMAIFWVDLVVGDYRRADITQAFADLKGTTAMPGPKFVIAHLVVPHPPFVFDENGGPVAPRGWGDGTSYAGGPDQYLEAYRRQLLYVDRVMEKIIVSIQEQSKTPPVIILQGDHGPGAYVDWLDWKKTCLRERMPILNAYYLPGENPAEIPADITPVNTFRVVFNRYFGTALPMQENHNYFVLLPRPYDYIEVTDHLDQCPQRP